MNMKKLIAFTLILALAFSLTACRDNNGGEGERTGNDVNINRPDGHNPPPDDLEEASATDFEFVGPAIHRGGSHGIRIANYIGGATRVRIPEMIDGQPVTLIDERTFQNQYITYIYIPNTIERISDNAFEGTGESRFGNEFKEVTLPYGLTYIGNRAFMRTGITTIEIPPTVTFIGNAAFANTNIDSIVIHDSVTYLGEGAFQGCTYLTSAVIGNGITRIYSNTFAQCSALTEVIIGENVEIIGNHAFSHTALTNVVLPDSVTTIESFAFQSLSLERFEFGAGITSISNDAFVRTRINEIYHMGVIYESLNEFLEFLNNR